MRTRVQKVESWLAVWASHGDSPLSENRAKGGVPRCSPGRHWASRRLGVWRAMSTQQPSRVPCSDLTLDCSAVNQGQKILSWLSGNVDTGWRLGNVNPLQLDLWMTLQSASGSIYEQAVLGDHVSQCYWNVVGADQKLTNGNGISLLHWCVCICMDVHADTYTYRGKRSMLGVLFNHSLSFRCVYIMSLYICRHVHISWLILLP